MHPNTERYTKWHIVDDILLGSDDFILKQLQSKLYPLSWKKKVTKWKSSDKNFQELKQLLITYKMIEVFLDNISLYLKTIFSGINYIAPLRATAERYYRIQHLAVNEVDPNGKNLPIFLDSLSETQLNNFQSWTLKNFNFKIKIQKTEGHYSIKVVHENDIEINLSDMGFGYSQILPILTQLWYSSSMYSKNTDRYSSISSRMPKIILQLNNLNYIFIQNSKLNSQALWLKLFSYQEKME